MAVRRAVRCGADMDAYMKVAWRDPVTGLEWSLTAEHLMPWLRARQWCNAHMDGWRMPTIYELWALWKVPGPSMPDAASGPYWSATDNEFNSDFAWCVNFDSGFVSYIFKDYSNYVRAVRGGC